MIFDTWAAIKPEGSNRRRQVVAVALKDVAERAGVSRSAVSRS